MVAGLLDRGRPQLPLVDCFNSTLRRPGIDRPLVHHRSIRGRGIAYHVCRKALGSHLPDQLQFDFRGPGAHGISAGFRGHGRLRRLLVLFETSQADLLRQLTSATTPLVFGRIMLFERAVACRHFMEVLIANGQSESSGN